MPLTLVATNTLRELRFMWLFVFLLLVLISTALFTDHYAVQFVVSLLYLNALLSALSADGSSPAFRYGMMGAWIISVIFKVLALVSLSINYLMISKFLTCLMLSVVVISIMRFVLFSRRVTGDTLFAAIVAYLILAMMFGQLYSGLDLLLPDAFNLSGKILTKHGMTPDVEFTYFSIVTIATLGYGDITPTHPLTQILAAIEAVVGQFYVAVIVAWLVSLYIIHHQDRRQ